MSDTHFKQAWNLVNEYFHSNQIDPSKYVDHELVRIYLKACQKSTPKGISISKKGNRLYLRFKTSSKSATADNSCNEDFTRDGCINTLAKVLAVFDKLKEIETESEFWSWYESEIKGAISLENDIITIGDAIEMVKKNYLSGYDKCDRDRSNEKLRTNTLANYHSTYGKHFDKLNPKLQLTGENIISELNRNWSQLFSISGSQTLCSKGFKNAYTGIVKLLRDAKLSSELDKVTSYFGKLKVTRKTKMQAIDLETFLDFRARVLGLNGYELTEAQWRNIESRKSWMKAICFNLLYGFRCSEFKAIRNLDEPVTIDGYTFKAHLANYHGKLAGLTRDQRALSLGHSQSMNDKYDKHQTTRNQVNLLMADISEKSENQRLKDELTQAQETIKSLEETILFLKKENARLNELLGGNDDLPRIGS